jgi:hypothetical protein
MWGVEWMTMMTLLYMSDGFHQLRRLSLVFGKDLL